MAEDETVTSGRRLLDYLRSMFKAVQAPAPAEAVDVFGCFSCAFHSVGRDECFCNAPSRPARSCCTLNGAFPEDCPLRDRVYLVGSEDGAKKWMEWAK